MSLKNRYTGNRRIRKAYWTALVVMLSYGRLMLAGKLFGARYYEKHILALHLRNAERVKKAILELNGLFIKIGQMLSILSNFLPEAFQKPLEELQDRIPPRPYSQVQERIRREFGKLPRELFARFDEEPLAAASIGQAHRAQLPDGTEVVVKVQHADIEAIAQIDLDIIRRLTRLIAFFFDIKGMDHLYSQVRKMIEEELDFSREAKSMEQIADNLREEEERLIIPAVHPAFSTARVLTTTWHEGVKISNLGQIDAWQVDRRDIAARLLHAYCHMLFKDGFYHADPHPGNILVQANGTLVLLDFGATGRLSSAMREGIPQLIEAAIKNDTAGMIDACRTMGFIAEGREAEQMAEKMITALRNFVQNEVQFEGLNFKDIEVKPFDNSLFHLIQEIGISGISGTVQVPKEYVLLNRMLTLLLGLCNTLDPMFNPLDVVRPYAQDFVLGQRGDLLTFVRNLLQNTITSTLALPEELRQTLQKTRRGHLEMLNPDVRDGARLLYLAIQQVLFALLALGLGGCGWWLSRSGDAPTARLIYGSALVFLFLWLRAWRRGGRLWRRME
ncbi:MAG: AarF/ABC1/UbiB kinase family protein [Bacteroidetes bacterium]|nr:MAG: AarF/ABC1/UbiB kinase family protein [Bacteroidota bacterium]